MTHENDSHNRLPTVRGYSGSYVSNHLARVGRITDTEPMRTGIKPARDVDHKPSIADHKELDGRPFPISGSR